MDTHYTYLLLNAFTFLPPFLLSFDKKVAFYKKWPRLFPAILISAFVFLVWDHFFTTAPMLFEADGKLFTGIWNFNPEYLVGIYLLEVPLEEWLFFFTIPYACLFIYEVLKAYFPSDRLQPLAVPFTIVFAVALAIVGVLNTDRWYTAITFIGFALLLLLQLKIGRGYMSRFWGMYWLHLLPFFVINGFLTALPVVVYNNSENLGVRLGTIPLEDPFYSGFLLLLIITLYERFNRPTIATSPS